MDLLARLKNEEIILGDGAMGSMLMQRGLKPGDCPENFVLQRPEIIEEITRCYVESGAEIIETCTFGASPMKLAAYGLEDKTEEINQKAVELAQKIGSGRAMVAASCGPSGAILKPYGEAEPDEVYQSFERQMQALISSGVNLLCIETMTDLQEATLALQAAKSVSSKIPVIATMTFDETARGFYTIMGVSIQEAADGLEKAGANVIGSNCGNGIENMIRIARVFKQVTRLPLIIQSNAGIPESKSGELVYPETPEFFAEKSKELVEAGVSIIGGCCGTTPEYIRAMKNATNI